VAAVCHQPDCSDIALAVSGSDPGFPPAGMVALTLEG
jgi:phosphohistidine phosphatase SixA